MKIHSTNYTNTFIEVAEDTKATKSEIPPIKKEKSVANYQYEIISENPYLFDSDDVLFRIHATRNAINEENYAEERALFFSKGQPCFRTSPLAKRYGWGIHHNENGKIAIYGMETEEYKNLLADSRIQKMKAMRSTKK